MKIPRHLRPKALSRALRKEKVDRVLERPRLKMSCYLHEMPAKQPEPAPGTREARRWELRARIQARRWAALRAARSGLPGSETPDGPATGVAHESGTAAPALAPTPSQRIGRDGPSERAADYVAGQSEDSMKPLLKQWAVGIAWIAAAVVAIVWLVRMNTLPLAVFWLACPAAAWLLKVRPVAACLTIRGRGILAIILIVLSIFASLAMNARRREVTDWLGNASLEGYTTLTEETDEQDDDDPRFSKGPRTGWTAKSGAGTFALTLFELALFASIFAVPLVTGWLTRDARNKMDQGYWRTEHEKARGLTADVQKP
jgi:hypothetical protein